MTDTHDTWLRDALQPLKQVPPSLREQKIRAWFLAEAVSNGAHNRPDIQTPKSLKGRSMRQVFRNRSLAACAALVLGVVASFFISPNLRAIAQEVLEGFFRREPDNQVVTVEEGSLSEWEPPRIGSSQHPRTAQEASRFLGDTLILPAAPPEGFNPPVISVFNRANGTVHSTTSYVCGRTSLLVLQNRADASSLVEAGGIPVGPDAIIETVSLGENTEGQYVRGTWHFDASRRSYQVVEIEGVYEVLYHQTITNTWDAEADGHILVWSHAGRIFLMIVRTAPLPDTDVTPPAVETDRSCAVTKDDLIRMAREMVAQAADADSRGLP